MHEIATELARWLANGEQIALATVVWAHGSSPRPPGSRMAVTASGKMAGSVSGGCVEGAVLEEAQEVLAGGPPKRLRYGPADEDQADTPHPWEIGLACGGSIEVYVEPMTEIHRRLLTALEAEETVALATHLGASVDPLENGRIVDVRNVRGHLLAWPDGRLEGDRSLFPSPIASRLVALFPGPAAELERGPRGDVFFEVVAPPPTLIIVGAVHIAMSLVTLAQALDFRVRVVDARRVFATRERFPTADELTVAWPQDVLEAEALGPHHYVVILSHDPKFDLPALRVVLRSGAAYVGLLGSRGTQEKRRSALREEGFSETELARIHGPVGLDLGGRKPSEIALAILAEIVAVRYGRSGAEPS